MRYLMLHYPLVFFSVNILKCSTTYWLLSYSYATYVFLDTNPKWFYKLDDDFDLHTLIYMIM